MLCESRVISHPAVTSRSRDGESDICGEHRRDARAPADHETRVRMVRYMGRYQATTADQMPWYPERRYPGVIGRRRSSAKPDVTDWRTHGYLGGMSSRGV